MQKTWYFKYKSQHFCVKYIKRQYWFFFGKEKLKNVWYLYRPYIQYEIIECFENIFGRMKTS
jgi:hypothetical protein